MKISVNKKKYFSDLYFQKKCIIFALDF